ncbi:hypothetical protein [Endozoicomonas acroporae]|uniref:hypothetical protein n=1 Tax=Endozoicomonas acroporae TaxID=1701104 RepID=UPI003D790195
MFQNSKEPLFGRADDRIHLQPLRTRFIAELLHDQKRFSPQTLLQWFMLSGAVPKYLEWLVNTDPHENIWQTLVCEHSLLIEEGLYRLAEEFGPVHGTYFSILSAIAASGQYDIVGSY